jgi:hypothetical protein
MTTTPKRADDDWGSQMVAEYEAALRSTFTPERVEAGRAAIRFLVVAFANERRHVRRQKSRLSGEGRKWIAPLATELQIAPRDVDGYTIQAFMDVVAGCDVPGTISESVASLTETNFRRGTAGPIPPIPAPGV